MAARLAPGEAGQGHSIGTHPPPIGLERAGAPQNANVVAETTPAAGYARPGIQTHA